MNPKITEWHGRRVWLVGASTGIGAAMARELAGRGAKLALSARSADKLQALGIDDALILPCDATDATSLAGMRHALLAAWGGVDLVVYLAGDYVPMRADEFDLARAEQVIEVNFNGALRLAATMLPDLQPGGGIAFVSFSPIPKGKPSTREESLSACLATAAASSYPIAEFSGVTIEGEDSASSRRCSTLATSPVMHRSANSFDTLVNSLNDSRMLRAIIGM